MLWKYISDGNRDKFGVLVSENSIYLFIGNFTEHNWAESITCINHGNDETWTFDSYRETKPVSPVSWYSTRHMIFYGHMVYIS